MRTADLPIGAHVAYDSYSGRSYHNFHEAYVIAHRPRGNKSSYWGNNGNHNTVGLMYQYKMGDKTNPIYFTWARPQDIHMTWDEYIGAEAAAEARRIEREAAERKARASRRKRVAALPIEVLKVLEMQPEYGWRHDDLIKRDHVNVYMTVDKLEAIVKAAQEAIPERKAERVAAEVESALRLLAG